MTSIRYTRYETNIFINVPIQQRLLKENLFSLDELNEEVSFLRERLTNVKSPVVFCHNDGMPANMVLKEDQTVALIDLEYGGPNHAAYDLANLFNEYSGCDEFLDYKKNYPNEYLMKDWISSYLAEFNGQEPTKVGFENNLCNDSDLIIVLGQYC